MKRGEIWLVSLDPSSGHEQLSHTHRIKDLVRVAGVEEELEAASKTDLQFAANWQAVEAWSEQSRYEPRTESDATNLLFALKKKKHGVLRWLKEHW